MTWIIAYRFTVLFLCSLIYHQLHDHSSLPSIPSPSFVSSMVSAADRKVSGSARHRRNKQEIRDRTNKEARERAEKEARRKPKGIGDTYDIEDDIRAGALPPEAAQAYSEGGSSLEQMYINSSQGIIRNAAKDDASREELRQRITQIGSIQQSMSDGECVKCPSADKPARYAIASFWKNDLYHAFSCACHALLIKGNDGLSQSIRYAISKSKYADFLAEGTPPSPPKLEAGEVWTWELLGPFPVGKLELDADPALAYHYDQNKDNRIDVAIQILLMPSKTQYPSELATDKDKGYVSWKTVKSNSNGDVNVQWSTNWHEIVNGVSNMAAFEFQGWGRSTSYVKQSGSYSINCNGVHSVYIRNDNITKVVTGDIYYTRNVNGILELKTGPLGIIIPLKATGQMQFTCTLSKVKSSLLVVGPRHVPDLMELPKPKSRGTPHRTGEGILLSNLFTMLLTNTLQHPLRVTFYVETGRSDDSQWFVRPMHELHDPKCLSYLYHSRQYMKATNQTHLICDLDENRDNVNRDITHTEAVTIAPGQMLNVPLQILVDDYQAEGNKKKDTEYVEYDLEEGGREDPHRVKDRGVEFYTRQNGLVHPISLWEAPTLSCRGDYNFMLTIKPSRGEVAKVPIRLPCRKYTESIVFSYLDHDGSVSQASFLFPLLSSIRPPPSLSSTPTSTSQKKPKSKPLRFTRTEIKSVIKDEMIQFLETNIDGSNDGAEGVELMEDVQPSDVDNDDSDAIPDHEVESFHRWSDDVRDQREAYSVLLTLHGTGISARSQADAYKVKLPNKPSGEEFLFGVEGFWVLAPSRHGAHNWEGVGELSAQTSVQALKDIMLGFTDAPQVVEVAGVNAGHSMGGHGALMTSVLNPDHSVCGSITAGWIRKEEYGHSNDFFNLDVQNSFIDPDLKRILEVSMSSYHPDKVMKNLHDMDIKIRVGAADSTTHPWYSRRMHRLMHISGVNSTLEEVANRPHWWWDSKSENDGGVLNDQIMRDFYAHCYVRASEHYSNVISSVVNSLSSLQHRQMGGVVVLGSEVDGRQKLPDGADRINLRKSKCFQDFTYVVNDVSIQKPLCGLRVLQNKYQTRKSTVSQKCYIVMKHEILFDKTLKKIPGSFTHNNLKFNLQDISTDIDGTIHICELNTSNVLRLRVSLPFSSLWSQSYESHTSIIQKEQAKTNRRYVSMKVDNTDLIFRLPYIRGHTQDDTSIGFVAMFGAEKGSYYYDDKGNAYIDLCWHQDRVDSVESIDVNKKKVFFCKEPMNALEERTPLSSGPLRNLFSKPLVIIYGTPLNQALRVAIKDLASYLANLLTVSHDTYVRVLSDLEYYTEINDREDSSDLHTTLENTLFIGGPKTNKFLRRVIEDDVDVTKYLKCKPPVRFLHQTGDDDLDEQFDIGEEFTFKGDDQAAIFNMPCVYQDRDDHGRDNDNREEELGDEIRYKSRHLHWLLENNARYGAIICANSAAGYLQIAKLAAPTVPPMVRAPFANNMPDYIVIDRRIWDLGFGGVKIAGYWSHDWKYSEHQAYLQ